MPHFIEFDHQGAAFRLGLLGVDFGEPLDPGHHAGRGHAQQLGGAVHRQPAHVEQDGGDLDPQRHAARRGVGEVQPARAAAVALLPPHQAVLDVLLAPAPLAPQPHRSTPPAVPPPTDIGNLRRPKTLDTVSFGFLMDAVESVQNDTELFKDVYTYNPHCKEVIARFEQAEQAVEQLLSTLPETWYARNER